MTVQANNDQSLGDKIVSLHHELMKIWPSLSRMAVAIYDNQNDDLKTFVNSQAGNHSLRTYSAKLSNVPSLKILAEARQERIINDLSVLQHSDTSHSRWLVESGFKSSYTLPLFGQDRLLGFLFFDAIKPDYFDRVVIRALQVYAELIEMLLVNELASIYTLQGALNTATHLTHQRDSETALHLKRMSHYAHIIARHLAAPLDLSDEYVEFILQYAPLHDVGKIGIADEILLKPGKLTPDEFEQVKLHVDKGVQILDAIVREFNLGQLHHLHILYNIVHCHHEKFDGSGYPRGLSGQDIPLEGRIVAVADVLDALTHPRPYKRAWKFDDALDFISEQSGSHFDPMCVDILFQHKAQFLQVFEQFKD